ncbi:hypothetical protein [Olleya sp. YS]|uniref:hypothetical protein n=1 Tax=Olleya sp. YS TaxID=3028318 RepID=UPI002434653B|nr:hypothetical protein [Olleya sp. YS]WGD34535.1 hypothetical protein Ollyesu_12190 [Olleya sp. YS]
MNTTIQINNEYNSLDKLLIFLSKYSDYTCSKEYDIWEIRTDANGQMEQCLVLKKSGMHAVKLYFTNENTVKVNYIIPNKMMHAYFGKSVKARQNIIEIIAGVIKQALLAAPQKKAFEELTQVVQKAA